MMFDDALQIAALLHVILNLASTKSHLHVGFLRMPYRFEIGFWFPDLRATSPTGEKRL